MRSRAAFLCSAAASRCAFTASWWARAVPASPAVSLAAVASMDVRRPSFLPCARMDALLAAAFQRFSTGGGQRQRLLRFFIWLLQADGLDGFLPLGQLLGVGLAHNLHACFRGLVLGAGQADLASFPASLHVEELTVQLFLLGLMALEDFLEPLQAGSGAIGRTRRRAEVGRTGRPRPAAVAGVAITGGQRMASGGERRFFLFPLFSMVFCSFPQVPPAL